MHAHGAVMNTNIHMRLPCRWLSCTIHKGLGCSVRPLAPLMSFVALFLHVSFRLCFIADVFLAFFLLWLNVICSCVSLFSGVQCTGVFGLHCFSYVDSLNTFFVFVPLCISVPLCSVVCGIGSRDTHFGSFVICHHVVAI